MRRELTAIVCVLVAACGSQDGEETEISRLRATVARLDGEVSNLESRISLLERSNKFAEEMLSKEEAVRRAEEESAERIANLKEDQKRLEEADELMCAVT